MKYIEEVLDPDIVNVKDLIHNMTQINKNGLVTNVDKKGNRLHRTAGMFLYTIAIVTVLDIFVQKFQFSV